MISSGDEPEEEFQEFNPTDNCFRDATEGDYVLTEFETEKKRNSTTLGRC